MLNHWSRVTHICVGKLTIIGSDNGLSPERRLANIWANAGILLIGPLGTNFSEILIEIQTFSLKKIHLKMSSAKCCSFPFGLMCLHQPNNPHYKTAMGYTDNKRDIVPDQVELISIFAMVYWYLKYDSAIVRQSFFIMGFPVEITQCLYIETVHLSNISLLSPRDAYIPQ